MCPQRRPGAVSHLKRLCSAGAFAVLAVAVRPSGAEGADVVALQTQAVKSELATQQKIDALHRQTQKRVAEQQRIERELGQVQAYREHLAAMVRKQEVQLQALQSQIDRIDDTETAVLPLLAEMAETLARFVELDVPFLLEERRRRAASLQAMLDDPEITVGEKYRRLMTGYHEEAKYGTNLQTYRDVLTLDGHERNVELLRVGRIALIYRTPDGREFGAWDPAGRRWVALPREHAGALRTAFRVADKQIAPELLSIPLPPPEPLR